MKPDTTWGPATVLVVALVVIVALAGAVVAVVNAAGDSGSFSFQDYVNTLVGAAVATGLLGIGRGYLAGKRAEAVTDLAAAEKTYERTP